MAENPQVTKVVLDGVGGDHAPGAILDGVLQSIERGVLEPQQVILTGPADLLEDEFAGRGGRPEGLTIHDAPDLLAPDDTPVEAMRRKPKNSIAVGIDLVKRGEAHAFISAGSTGVVVATAQVILHRLAGIRRPGIAVTIEGERGPFVLVDAGANPQAKAIHLLHYAYMGAAYFKKTFGKDAPRVGMVNIGSEDLKGNPLTRRAGELMKASPLNFVGNVEGVDVYNGTCDVIICDGFTGNVMLKVSEGVAESMLRMFADMLERIEIAPDTRRQLFSLIKGKVDYSEYGGALLLGVEGIVTICHGRSRGPAIHNAICFASKAVGARVNEQIVAMARGEG